LDKERKIQIIKAAVKRFTKHGLHKTTLDEVARDLRIGKATIYNYFESKEDLYYKTLLYEISLYIEEIKLILNNEAKKPRQIVIEFLELKENLGNRYRLVFELLLHILTGTHIEPEIQCLNQLLIEEASALRELLMRTGGKEEYSSLPGFFAAQSWGFLFSSILKNTANPVQGILIPGEEEAAVKKENLIKELENFFAAKGDDKK
jgi:AcrR family transcriptional regulator